MWIDDLTWPEIRDAIAAGKRTAIVYTGSSEQNGPHMVIGKHNIVAHYVAQRIAEQLGDALVYPVMPFSVTGTLDAQDRPHAVSGIGDAASGGLRQLSCAGWRRARSRAGFKVVALMGDHGGGQAELAKVAKELDAQHRKEGVRVLYIGDLYYKSDADLKDWLTKHGLPHDVHAGMWDTSPLLYLEKPGQWIRKDKFAEANEANGVVGNPSLATPEIGKAFLDIKVDNAVKQIRALMAAQP